MQSILGLPARLIHIVLPSFIVALLLLSLHAPVAHAQEAPALEFVESTPLSFSITSDPIQWTVFIRNRSSKLVKLQFNALMQNGKGSYQQLKVIPSENPSTPLEIDGFTVKAFNLKIEIPPAYTSDYAKGQLVVAAQTASDVLPGTRELLLNAPATPFGPLLLIPLGLSVALVSACALISWRMLTARMQGSAEWDFTKSWASTTTVGASLLNVALLTFIPQNVNTGLSILAVIFAVLVFIAPFFYNAWITEVRVSTKSYSQGIVIFYFLACVITLWGVFGGLCLGYILVNRIDWELVIADPLIWGLRNLPVILGVAVAIYSVRTMLTTVRKQVAEAEALEVKIQRAKVKGQEVDQAAEALKDAARAVQAQSLQTQIKALVRATKAARQAEAEAAGMGAQDQPARVSML